MINKIIKKWEFKNSFKREEFLFKFFFEMFLIKLKNCIKKVNNKNDMLCVNKMKK